MALKRKLDELLRERKRSFPYLAYSKSWEGIKEMREEQEPTAQGGGSLQCCSEGLFTAFADSPERSFSLLRISTQSFQDMMKEGKEEGVMTHKQMNQLVVSVSQRFFVASLPPPRYVSPGNSDSAEFVPTGRATHLGKM